MDTKPSNKLIAEQSGLTEAEVGTYLTALEMQADGSWMVYFGVEVAICQMPTRKLTPPERCRFQAGSPNTGSIEILARAPPSVTGGGKLVVVDV